ncbi:hypothetical protein A2424_07155 [Candidatus Peribacteria bacterium RIFOXYC1_FULL_54_13]|nr:MAG: hypothetical protein A2424_07155 [Candidatus Peribacteria bacterium RIFOXYC1_FULL_54_13]
MDQSGESTVMAASARKNRPVQVVRSIERMSRSGSRKAASAPRKPAREMQKIFGRVKPTASRGRKTMATSASAAAKVFAGSRAGIERVSVFMYNGRLAVLHIHSHLPYEEEDRFSAIRPRVDFHGTRRIGCDRCSSVVRV